MSRRAAMLSGLAVLALLCGAVGQVPGVRAEDRKFARRYDVSRLRERGVGRGFNVYRSRDEMEMGQDMAEEVEATTKLLTDSATLSYVQQLGDRLVASSDSEMPMRFKVLESDEINAFALPNGVIYVTTGLLLAAESEAELAGVLGHEIGHVAAHHAARNSSKRELLGFANLAVTMLSGGVVQAVGEPVMGIASMGLNLKFDRSAEREADVLGIEYAYLSGFDPAAYVSFLERAGKGEKAHSGWLDRMLATHPATLERIALAQKAIQLLLAAKLEYVLDSSEFQAVREKLGEEEARQLGLDVVHKPVLRKIARVDAVRAE